MLVLRKRGAAGAILPSKQRVNIFLDGAVIEHLKAKAADRGHQTLINEALRQAINAESIETEVLQQRDNLMDRRHTPSANVAGPVATWRSLSQASWGC